MIALTATTITITAISGFTSPLAQITVIASIRSNIITLGAAVAIFKGNEHIVVQHVVVVDGLVLGVYHLIIGGGRILILGVASKEEYGPDLYVSTLTPLEDCVVVEDERRADEHIIHRISHMQETYSYELLTEAKALGAARKQPWPWWWWRRRGASLFKFSMCRVVVVVVSIALQKLWQQVRGGRASPF